MNGLFGQIIEILTNPPGNLAYHLVLAFSVVGALQSAHSDWRNSGSVASRRMVTGLGLVLFARLAMFLAAGIAWQGLINEHLLLPPLDRGVTLLSVILVVWLWAFPEPVRLADAATVLLSLLALTGLGLSMLWWNGMGAELEYNASWPALGAEIATLAISLVGGMLVLARRRNGWGPGLATLGILSIGHILFLVLPAAGGDYPGIVRLAQMIAFPILLMLPHRLAEYNLVSQLPVVIGEKRETTQADLGLMPALLALGNETDTQYVCRELTRLIAKQFVSDLCLLISPPDSHGRMTIQCGYDLIREVNLDGSSLNSRSIPVVVSSFRRGRPLYLPDSSTSPDLKGLGEILGLKRVGNLLALPILNQQSDLVAGIILLTPYSSKTWTAQDQDALMSISGALAQLLHRNQAITQLNAELAQVREALQIAQNEVQNVQRERQNLLARFSDTGRENGGAKSQAASLAALIAAQEEAQDMIDRLKMENEQLYKNQRERAGSTEADLEDTGSDDGMLQGSSSSEYLEGELRMALEEIAHLRSMLYEADIKLLELSGSSGIRTGLNGQSLDAFSEQLRQPLASIIGYTDFLLGESVGILGTQQKKFMERIRSSTQRITGLVDELSLASDRDARRPPTPFEAVSLSHVIDAAVDRVRPCILEKNIALRVDLPKNLPKLRTERASLQKILGSLLENASDVTPNGGEVTLRARLKTDPETQDYLLVQVSDQGNGVSPGNLPGESLLTISQEDPEAAAAVVGSAGMPAVKAIVESLSGRLWVDMEAGAGCVYSLLLPVSPPPTGETGSDLAQ